MQGGVLMPRLFDPWSYVCGSNIVTIEDCARGRRRPSHAPHQRCGVPHPGTCFAMVLVAIQRLVLVSLSPVIASFLSSMIGLESIRAFAQQPASAQGDASAPDGVTNPSAVPWGRVQPG